ncbi:MAG TPA: MFS transporter [Candidatus Binataceae bacterium]|nr:MFS transporter [Candidatus Binataceae bacterium]
MDFVPVRPRRRLKPRWLNASLTWLFVVRALRSASQGYLAIIVPLYVAVLGYDAVHLGILFTAAAIASAVLTALVGIYSDRFGRKNFLIAISLLTVFGGLAFAVSTSFVVLVLAAAIGTIGRGGGAASAGNWGPFYPAEQALIAEHADDASRTTIFGVLSFVGVIAGAIGSLLAWLPRLLTATMGLPALSGYRVLFLLTAVVGVAMAAAVVPVTESRSHPATQGPSAFAPATLKLGLSPASWRIVAPLALTNVIQGFGMGMLGPLIVYWFYRGYGAGPGELATLFFVINLAAALPYLLAGRLALSMGAVLTVTVSRLVGVVLLVAMIFMPTFFWAAVFYALQMIAATVSVPVAQSYLMGVVGPAERASAAGVSTVPWQVGSMLAPYFSGYLMEYAALDLPVGLSAALTAVGAVLYYFFFRDILLPEEMETPRRQTVERASGESVRRT